MTFIFYQQQKVAHPRIQIGLHGSQFPTSAMPGQRISLASYQQSMACEFYVPTYIFTNGSCICILTINTFSSKLCSNTVK